jgi:hypothetical protein
MTITIRKMHLTSPAGSQVKSTVTSLRSVTTPFSYHSPTNVWGPTRPSRKAYTHFIWPFGETSVLKTSSGHRAEKGENPRRSRDSQGSG